MKVTKIVREYIEQSVREKFTPALDAVREKYDVQEKAYTEAVAAAKKEVKAVWVKHLAPFYSPDALEELMKNHTEYEPSSYRTPLTWRDEKREKEDEVRDELDKTVKDILITLELGGTKADLDRMLSEINPRVEV